MLPLPPITSNTSHYRICRRCAAPCLQLCACRCCSHMLPLPPIRTNTSHYRICRRCATLHATLRLPLFFSFALSLQSQPIPHTTVFTDGSPPSACNFAPAAVVLMFLSLQAQPIPHTTVLADGAPPPACNFAPAAVVSSHAPSPLMTTNTSHYRICRRCATLHATLRLPLLFSCSLSPQYNQSLTPPYWQTVRHPACKFAPAAVVLMFLSLQSQPIPHTTVLTDGALPPCLQLCACRCSKFSCSFSLL
jgi:hypothetical protein